MGDEKSRESVIAFANSINQVEGFDPWKVIKEVASPDGDGKTAYLPLIYKKMWARAKYPLHRVHAEIKGIKDGFVQAYAAFYPTNAPDASFIGEGFAFTPINGNAMDPNQAINEAVLLAIGSAKSRAYTDAGFGLQFWTDDVMDDIQLSANISEEVQKQLESMAESKAAEETSSPIDVMQEDNLVTEVAEPTVTTGKGVRRTQIEILIDENNSLSSIRESLTDIVKDLKEGIDDARIQKSQAESDWKSLQASMRERLQKNSVKKEVAKNPIGIITETFEEAWEAAEKAVISSTGEITPEIEAMAAAYDSAYKEQEAIAEAAADIMALGDREDINPVISPIEVGSEKSEEPALLEGEQLSFIDEMSLGEAYSTITTVDAPAYNGKSIKEVVDKNKNLLFTLLDRTKEKRERQAIIKVIRSDSDLMAYADRHNKKLAV